MESPSMDLCYAIQHPEQQTLAVGLSLIGRLDDLRGRSHTWYTIRLTLENGIDSIRVSIQVLDLIPELRLIERSVGIHSSGELAIDCLIGLIATAFLVRSTSAGCDIRCDIAVVLRCACDAAGSAVPHTAQVGMAIRCARSRNRR